MLRVNDGNDLAAIAKAIETAQATTDRPTLICLKTHIGYGSPHKQDTHGAHGEPLGADEIKLTKKVYGWPEDAQFLVPEGVYDRFKNGIGKRGADAPCRVAKAVRPSTRPSTRRWPPSSKRWRSAICPSGWDKDIPTFPADAKGIATRESSGQVLNAIAKNVPWVMGGSADLNPSTKTFLKFDGAGTFTADNPGGRNIHFGVREHAMGAIINGIDALEAAGLWLRVPDFLRLRPRRRSGSAR